MRLYALGHVTPRFFSVSAATNATPIVITTSTPHGFSMTDVITISGITGNTNANGTYVNTPATPSFTLTASTITLLNKAGNGALGGTGIASAPQQIIASPRFPTTMAEFLDPTQARAARIVFYPQATGTAVIYVGTAGLNQATEDNCIRAINPPPTSGRFDSLSLHNDGTDSYYLSDYWIDCAKPATESVMVSFWIR